MKPSLSFLHSPLSSVILYVICIIFGNLKGPTSTGYVVDNILTVRAHLRPGMCYVLVHMELRCICGTDTQGDKSLLDAWAEMRRKLSSHSAQVWLYIMGRQHGERS